MKKKDYLYISILLAIPLLLIWFLLPSGHIFGNSTDWFNQHVMLSDALRHAIKEQGTLFPTYMPHLMGGVNIYHFSYYGYLRPDVIIGALLMHVEMIDIIIGYSVFNMMLSAISCYLFLRHQNDHKEVCFFVSILVILSTLFFQSHKQIMFVNYMPFLFLSLLSIDYYLEKKHLTPFIICGSLMMLHSYFYSIGCYLICLIYYVYKHYLNDGCFTHYDFMKLVKGFILIGLLTAILTIPTLFVIAGNGKSVNAVDFLSLFQMKFDLKGLLYNNYGCGLTYLVWILLVLGFNYQKTRVLSAITLLATTLPLMSYIFNGFLYARSKILIVFIPIVAYIICEVIDQILKKQIEWNYFSIFVILIPLCFINKPFFVVIDILICVFIYLAKDHFKHSYFLYLLVPLFVVYLNNPTSSFIAQSKYQKVTDQEKTILVERHQKEIIRLGDFEDNHQTVNHSYKDKVARASGYTSTNHSLYNQFLYDTLRLPISINNRVANQDNNHIFYLSMMSINTIITKNKHAVGYSLIDKQNEHLLYQNPDVMPLAYASNNLYSQKQFEQLSFPQTLDTLYNHVIVEKGNTHYQSQFIKEDLGLHESYHIQNKKKQTITKALQRLYQNKILVIEFDVNNNHPDKAVEITINGMKNKLSSINAPYYNNNTHFTYVLSDENVIEQLQITLSKGDYEINHLKTYSLNDDVIKNRSHQVDSMDIKKGPNVLNGQIKVSHDGYFVTNIPYDKGYSIYIDNQKVETEIVNTAFLGCPITKGQHTIKVTFQPQGYQLAIHLSALGLTLTLLNVIYERKKKNER